MSRVQGNGFWTFLGKMFLDHFLDPATKPRSQGFDPDLFMTELPCHQLGAKIKWVILSFRPGSTYQHQKIKFSCRCWERVRLKRTLPAVFIRVFFSEKNTIAYKKSKTYHATTSAFSQGYSKILAICTRYRTLFRRGTHMSAAWSLPMNSATLYITHENVK